MMVNCDGVAWHVDAKGVKVRVIGDSTASEWSYSHELSADDHDAASETPCSSRRADQRNFRIFATGSAATNARRRLPRSQSESFC
jgi:hypothetical protein